MDRLRRNGTWPSRPGTGEMIAMLRSIVLVSLAAAPVSSASAQAPIQITPPAQDGARPAQPARPKVQPKTQAPKAPAPKAQAPAAAAKSAPKPAPPAPAESPRNDDEVWPPPPAATPFAPAPAGVPSSPSLVAAFTAYQRGNYVTAFAEATRLAGDNGDPKAMALLGELYSNGAGVPQDYKKAAEWFALAAERGDAAASFALAMLHLGGRGGPRDLNAAVKHLT